MPPLMQSAMPPLPPPIRTERDIDDSSLWNMRFIFQRLDDLMAASVRIERALQVGFAVAPGTAGSPSTSGAVAEVHVPIHNGPVHDETNRWPLRLKPGARSSEMVPLANFDLVVDGIGKSICGECVSVEERRQLSEEAHGSNDKSSPNERRDSSPPGQVQERGVSFLLQPHGSEGFDDNAECHSDDESTAVMKSSFRIASDGDKFTMDCVVTNVEARRSLGRWADKITSRALDRPIYSAEDMYSATGWAQALARNPLLDNLTALVILVNVLYIGIYNDWDKTPHPADLYKSSWRFILIENVFCVYYCFELLTRFLAFQEKRASLRDFRFAFDALLCLNTVCDAWVWPPLLAITNSTSVAKLDFLNVLRISRIARVARFTRWLPEMVTLWEGIYLAYRTVVACLLTVLVLVYAGAITLNTLLDADDAINAALKQHAGLQFLTVSDSAWALVHVTLMLDSTGNLLNDLRQHGTLNSSIACALLLFYILLTTYTILNLLVGKLCNVVHNLVLDEQDAHQIRLMKDTILVLLKNYDSDCDGYLTQPELRQVMNDASSKETLAALDVNRLFLLEMQNMCFPKPHSKLSILECMEMMIMCLGNNVTTVKTLASGLSFLSGIVDNLGRKLDAVHYAIEQKLKPFPN